MPAKKALQKQPNVVIPPAPEGEDSGELTLEADSSTGSGKGKRTSDAYKEEILDWIDAYNAEKGRGGQSAAAKHFKVSMLTLGNWRKKLRGEGDSPSTPRKTTATTPSKAVDMEAVYKVLGGKGFKFQLISTYGPKGIETEFKGDSKIDKLNLIPFKGNNWESEISDGSSYVISTSNKVIVAMTIEQLLQLASIKP